jgi:hypothetical protein
MCGQVLAGEFMIDSNGIPLYHPFSAVVQTWNGYNWTIGSDNYGRLAITISGSFDLAK